MTFSSPNVNSFAVEVWEWIRNFTHIENGCDYLSMVGLKLNHVSKKGYI